MIIIKPIAANIDPHNRYTTRLHFEGGAVKDFYMRGSIAWPEGKHEGFALMAGYDIQEQAIIIFAQFPFWTIPHWLNDDQTLREREDGGYYLGLVQFIQDNVSRYKCASYYFGGQHIDVWRRYARQAYKNDMMPRRLQLIEVPYVDVVGDDLVHESIKTRTFRSQADSSLSKAIYQFKSMETVKNIDHGNEILALAALLAGFQFQPWVDLKRFAA